MAIKRRGSGAERSGGPLTKVNNTIKISRNLFPHFNKSSHNMSKLYHTHHIMSHQRKAQDPFRYGNELKRKEMQVIARKEERKRGNYSQGARRKEIEKGQKRWTEKMKRI